MGIEPTSYSSTSCWFPQKPTQAKMVPPPGAAPGYRDFQSRVSTAITKAAFGCERMDLNHRFPGYKPGEMTTSLLRITIIFGGKGKTCTHVVSNVKVLQTSAFAARRTFPQNIIVRGCCTSNSHATPPDSLGVRNLILTRFV